MFFYILGVTLKRVRLSRLALYKELKQTFQSLTQIHQFNKNRNKKRNTEL